MDTSFTREGAVPSRADLLRSGSLQAARALAVQETELPEDAAPTALIQAAIQRLVAGTVRDSHRSLLITALTLLLLQMPGGPERERLTDEVEDAIGRFARLGT